MKNLFVFLFGLMIVLAAPKSLWAQEPTASDPHASSMTIEEHEKLVAAEESSQQLWNVMEQVAGEDGSQLHVSPHAGVQVNVPISSTLLDYKLPGTQPGGVGAPLVGSETCTGCHVDHIRDNFNGSMMTNGVRDPLFRAALVVANKDANYGGDLCIRCHSPTAWLNNRSNIPGNPASTDGRLINADDLHGISCVSCHRMVPTSAMVGEAPGDDAERKALTGPFILGSGGYIIDRNDVRRGPFAIAAPPHAVAQSSFMQSAQMCATCHDIDNPLLSFDQNSGEFKLNANDAPASSTDRLFPLDRSYSEWKASQFANGGVIGLDYPGLKRATGTEAGPVTVCQDCHMPMVASPIAVGGPQRTVGKHQWLGANVNWQDGIVKVWDTVAADTKFDKTQTEANKAASLDLLKRAAQLDVTIINGQIEVKITNNSGHKLPTGYGEGRRMWIEVYQLRGSTPVFTSGLMSGVVGPLIKDPYLKTYEIKLGLSDAHAQAIGDPNLAGESFHIMLNNKVFKDNRIPPRGFTNAAFAARDMQPVGTFYPDGQYWDLTNYPLHPEADSISVRLMYQTATSDYIDFLAEEANVEVPDAVRGPTNWGQIVDELRDQNIGKPVAIAGKQIAIPRVFVAPSGTDTGFCTDSAQPCKTIGYAHSQAVEGAEIRVAAGVYKEVVQIIKRVSLMGGFTITNWITPSWTINQTILDGQNSYRPLTINANFVKVDGFVVRNGNATGGDRTGGGIYVGAVNVVDQATLVNLRIENNIASTEDSGSGGGLYAEMGNTVPFLARLILQNVSVISNTATSGNLAGSGGGIFVFAAGNSPLNVDMTNVVVQSNTAGNTFSSNGGGMSLRLRNGRARLDMVRILDNRAAQIKTFLGGPSRGGGIYLVDGEVGIRNGLVAGNFGERGDAISVQSSGNEGATVSSNYVTFANNFQTNTISNTNDAGAILHSQGPHVYYFMSNTLLSGNPVAFEALNGTPPPELFVDSVLVDNNIGTVVSGTVVISSTILRGAANFVNAAAGDFHLTATSDAVDKGNNFAPLVDLDGVFRPKGAASDIGAFEFLPDGREDQLITFGAFADKLMSDPPFTIDAIASSGLPVHFGSLTGDVCTVNGKTVTLVTIGTCTIQAGQAGDANFNPAPPISRSFAVKSAQRTDQTITFAKPVNRILGELPFELSATASSGLPVAFIGDTPSVCTVDENIVTLVAVGVCVVTATQNGIAAINPATPVSRSFTVSAPSGGGGEQVYLPVVMK